MKSILFILFLVIFLFPLASAYHFIYGTVNDAKDGEGADGHKIVLWNPSNGINDNLTDIIGPTGQSYSENKYMVDCELLDTPCTIDDILSIKVINEGDDYLSEIINVTVTGSGFDQVNNLTLNSIPTVFLNSPLEGSLQNSSVDFNCSYFDWDYPKGNLTLYGNWSGSWQVENVSEIDGSPLFRVFHETLLEGVYSYSCRAEDNLSVGTTSNNVSFIVDTTAPTINWFVLNESFFCGDTLVEAKCNIVDNYGLSEVYIQAISPEGIFNHPTSNISSNFSANILINASGEWNFTCFAKDLVYNEASLNISNITDESGKPDLSIYNISFSDNSPYEGEQIVINATVQNTGCSEAVNFLVGAYIGDPLSGGENISPLKLMNISGFSLGYIDFLYSAKVGLSNIFIYADNSSIIDEENESNNIGNNSVKVSYWQNFYGMINQSKVLGFDHDFFNSWVKENGLSGNVYLADMESSISWLDLIAIGKNSTGQNSSNDFSEIDSLIGMSGEDDSVYNVYTNSGQIKQTSSFTIHDNLVDSVPIVNSTNNSNFITGILWDSSDDSNGEYDSGEKEDIVFVSKINQSSLGAYGIYDYEMKVPATLREYSSVNTQDLYFYYELE